jgi:CRISPR-associated protein Cas1
MPAGDPPIVPLPDYLPVRMLNEFIYCPRLFYYEWVEGVFVHSADTVEGALRHSAVDTEPEHLPAELGGKTLRVRSVQLASEQYGIVAKMDLVESDGPNVVPIEYKKGRPREGESGFEAWPPDRIQVIAQAMILRSAGYGCERAVIYYSETKTRVEVPINDRVVIGVRADIEDARATARLPLPPPPLVDSSKCAGCSLVGFCLPDETAAAVDLSGDDPSDDARGSCEQEPSARSVLPPAVGEDGVRRLVPARDDLRPLYLTGHDFTVGKSGNTLRVRSRSGASQDVRIGEISQVNVFGGVQISASAIKALCDAERPVSYFSHGGWFYGSTQGLGLKNVFLRRDQFRAADTPEFCLRIARSIVRNKIRNQRTLLQRNHVDLARVALQRLARLAEDADRTESLESLLGVEGTAAATYFGNFTGMLKASNGADESRFTFAFEHRNRRPPRDPINAMLSFGYSLLAKDLTIIAASIGFDPFYGFYHQPRFGRPALALDLMEAFRPLVVDSTVLTVVNTRMVRPSDFIEVGDAVAMKPATRKVLIHAYGQRLDTLVTHPIFRYRVSYRRVLEIQARLLARVVTGEIAAYPGFETR